MGNAFLLESVGTFLLVFTVLFTAVYKKNIADNMAPAAIGWSVMLAHMVLIPFTGCGKYIIMHTAARPRCVPPSL
jgi:glycerol uptake facilitator-like aquaporin